MAKENSSGDVYSLHCGMQVAMKRNLAMLLTVLNSKPLYLNRV